MKSKVMALLLSGVFYSAMADEPKTKLIVWAKDGTKVAYLLAENPKVTFTETDLVIMTNEVEVNYALENMTRFTYESNTNTAIANLQTNGPSFKFDGATLLFPMLKANNTVAVYSLNGALAFKKTIQKDGEYAFSISNLNAGVYIVNVNGLTYKVVKK